MCYVNSMHNSILLLYSGMFIQNYGFPKFTAKTEPISICIKQRVISTKNNKIELQSLRTMNFQQ